MNKYALLLIAGSCRIILLLDTGLVHFAECILHFVQWGQRLKGTRLFWTTGHSDHAVTRCVWRFASPRLRLGIGASLLSVSIGSQHIVWLVFTVRWEQWISSAIGSIRADTRLKSSLNRWSPFKFVRAGATEFVRRICRCALSENAFKGRISSWQLQYSI